MKKSSLSNIALATAFTLSLAMVSCKDSKPGNDATDKDMTTESTGSGNADTMNHDIDTSDSTNTVNPDTIMGP